jgi:hypothetical protein
MTGDAPHRNVAPQRIEPKTIKQHGVGLRCYDPNRASPGFTLFTSGTEPTVYLIDMEGRVVHTWNMPEPPGLHGYLTERGSLLYMGNTPNDRFIGRSRFHGGVVREVDWEGDVLWEVRQPDQSHDAQRLRSGNVLLLCSTPLPDEIAANVRAGQSGIQQPEGRLNGDYMQEMTVDGQIVWEWRSWEHLNPEEYAINVPQDECVVWPQGDSISEMPDGNILISFRNISTVAMIARQSGDIYWKLGAPPLSGQHAPYILSNGNILLVDNGPHQLGETAPCSRVLEIDPITKGRVWQYVDTPPWNFYSPSISNAQRLPNGNTLICEGCFGRMFEVTTGGEIVWEYINPYFGGSADPVAQINLVFRAYRYSAEEIARARQASSSGR